MTAALSGCGGDDSNTTVGTTVNEPAYGVPATETFDPTAEGSGSATSTTGGETTGDTSGTDSRGSTGTDTETGTDSGSTTAADTGSTSIEPDYGVPDTGG